MILHVTAQPVEPVLLWVSSVTALLLGLLLPFAVRPLLVRWNMVDVPTERSSHTRPTYRGMGLATALAAIITFALALTLGLIPSDRAVSLAVLAGMLGACLLGWFEDVRGVSILVRFACQLLLGLLVTTWVTLSLGTSFFWIPLGVLAIAAYINVVNFMDGVNGISGIHGALVGAFYTYAGIVNHLPWLAAGGIALALAFLAFLPWNVRSGRNVFLGDAGSYFLGGAIASMAVGAFLSGVYVEYLLPPLLIYLADTGFTLCKRIVRGEQWYKPHRTHIYQQLTDLGFSHLGSALTVAGFTVIVTIISLLSIPTETRTQLWSGVSVIATVLIYLSLPALIKKFRA